MQARFFFLAKRFVAGETIASAIAAVRDINAQKMTATLDFLGEDVTDWTEAQHILDVYREMLDTIEREDVQTNVSVKLTALGLLLDKMRARAVWRRSSNARHPYRTRSCESTWRGRPSRSGRSTFSKRSSRRIVTSVLSFKPIYVVRRRTFSA